MQHFIKLAFIALALSTLNAQAATIDFENLPLASDSYYFPEVTTTFSSGNASFQHNYEANFGSWDGFVYSNKLDTVTEGWDNQYSAYASSVSTYGLAYYSSYSGTLPTITFDTAVTLASASFTNTTYATLSMIYGDGFAKQFGGATGNDADWFKLVINGHDATGASTGSVDFYLADFRFEDNSQDYIVRDWTSVNLASLGQVSSLTFTMQSSDVGAFGINTPTYFAIDNIVTATPVPEPEQMLMMILGLATVSLIARRRKQ